MNNPENIIDNDLETICPICGGTGGSEMRYDKWRCHNCNGAGYIPTALGERILALVRHNFKLTPRAIIETLKLRRPIYQKTAAYGHFGRSDFAWEQTSMAGVLARGV